MRVRTMSKSKGRFTQAELNRVIKAANGRRVVVRLSSDGVIFVIGDDAATDNGGNNPWDEVLSNDNDETQPKRPA
jgi:hypothetical protein